MRKFIKRELIIDKESGTQYDWPSYEIILKRKRRHRNKMGKTTQSTKKITAQTLRRLKIILTK